MRCKCACGGMGCIRAGVLNAVDAGTVSGVWGECSTEEVRRCYVLSSEQSGSEL
jgi:hypothetical protein